MGRLLITLLVLGFASNLQAAPEGFSTIDTSFADEWITGKLAIRVNTEQYSWSGSNDTSGWQNVTPITVTYRHENLEMGARTAYIFSENSTANHRGSVHTLSDTAFSFAYTQPFLADWDIRLNLDYNAPTGKATLSGTERNAVMNGNLVQQTRFGEGHNVTPGFVLSKSFGDNVSLGVGLSYTIRGSFDPNALAGHDRFNPGDELRASLQGRYKLDDWLFMGGLIFMDSGTTRVNHQKYFRKGRRFDVNLTTIYSLPDAQKLSGSFRYGIQDRDTYTSSVTGNFEKESHNINGDSVYLALEYTKIYLSKHTFKMSGALIRIDKNSYDPLNDLYYAGRLKWQIGLGYDYQIAAKKIFHFKIQNIEMHDKATPIMHDTRYSGWNMSAGFDWFF